MKRLATSAIAALLLVLATDLPAEEKFTAEQLEFFEKRVRPLLVQRCHECHAAEKQEGSLRLDSLAAALKGGDTGPAVVPGKWDQGELPAALAYDPDGYQMPPGGKLPESEVAVFRRWIEMGAPWPSAEDHGDSAIAVEFNLADRAGHWSFQPLSDPFPRDVQDLGTCRTPVDNFIIDKLSEQSLTPSAEADRRTWLRRASLDVIGLPPTPEEVEAFVRDDRPDAFERVVDRLLASPHFGERWGRHWLDLVRYAESRGHEFDYDVANAWKYRDYVIRALNDDVPFDRFVVEHVAGDLLRPMTTGTERPRAYPVRLNPDTEANESILGTGFWFLGEWVHSPVDIRQEEADRFDNMIDVFGKAFLGLTIACARCHDHKFDPIRSADFYALQGYLQSSSYRHAPYEALARNQRIASELAAVEESATPAVLAAAAKAVAPAAERLPAYLEASGGLIRAGVTTVPKQTEVVFEDFESGTYDGWTSEGDAFGTGPQSPETIAPYQGNVGAVGRFFVNSHQKRDGGQGDSHRGKLTSRPFAVEHDAIEMLVGGGGHADKTCVNLIINGKRVLSATGRNDNRMFPVRWDVREWRGQSAMIEIVDDESGGWGNIGVDQIVFRGRESSELSEESRARVAESAALSGLQPETLAAWIETLLAASRDPHSPFHRWGKRATAGEAILPLKPVAAGEPVVDTAVPPVEVSPSPGVWTAESFLTDSPAFRLRPIGAVVEWSSASDLPISSISWNRRPCWTYESSLDAETAIPGNMAEPGAMSSWRQGTVLKSPTFEVQDGRIWCLIKGGANTYVSVDSHRLINGPLHGSLVKQHPATPGWRWVEHRVNGYAGHRAHVEFYPRPGEELSVAAVIESETVPELGPFVPQQSPGEQTAVLDSAEAIRDAAGRTGSEAAVTLLGLAVGHPHLFGLSLPEARQNLAQSGSELATRRRELLAQVRRESLTAPCMLDGTGEDEYVFIRGSWRKRGATVPRRFLEVFAGLEHSAPEQGSGRLELALQMVNPEQTPILPRVIVNRIWQHYFGRGIVPTPDDFGHLGQPPSHPELLDWLAGDLIRHGWSLKQIHRRILLSATYRRRSDDRPDTNSVDPQNLLLSRMPVKRLEGEAVRDALLAVSGRLDSAIYGPSVPIHLTSFLEGRGRPGQSGPVDGSGRRSLYLSVRRNFPDPLLQAFDFPNPHSCTGRRNVSNVPAQALAMLNNPLVTEQAAVWARRLLNETPGTTSDARVRQLFTEAFSRDPSQAEMEFALAFLSEQQAAYRADAEDIRVWTDYCHVLFNLKEFVFVR